VGAKRHRLKIGAFPAWDSKRARKRASNAIMEADQGRDLSVAKRQARNAISFNELADRYVTHIRDERKNRSWQHDEHQIDVYLRPKWGTLAAHTITRAEHARPLFDEMKQRAPVLANRVINLVGTIYKRGIRKEWVPAMINPADGIDRNDEGDGRDRVLSEQELRNAWRAAEQRTPAFRAIFKLLVLTSQRRGEVAGMAWDELDLDAGWWTIPAEGAKNKREHRVPLTEPALLILAQRNTAPDRDDVLVFPRPHSLAGASEAPDHSWFANHIDAVRKASGVTFRLHDIRRTGATIANEAGESEFNVDLVLNHIGNRNKVSKTYNRYRYDREKRQVLETLAERISQILAGAPGKVLDMSAARAKRAVAKSLSGSVAAVAVNDDDEKACV
jgi:integrase